jgi:hypothetical protein
MCVTHSLADEEKTSTEIDNHHTTDDQSDALVRIVTYLFTVDDDDDPNFDSTAPVLEDESPYPEVRSAVANTDDPTMPSSTIRAWVVGLFWAVVLSGANQFFLFRYPSDYISQVCEKISLRRFSLPFEVPVAKSNPAR